MWVWQTFLNVLHLINKAIVRFNIWMRVLFISRFHLIFTSSEHVHLFVILSSIFFFSCMRSFSVMFNNSLSEEICFVDWEVSWRKINESLIFMWVDFEAIRRWVVIEFEMNVRDMMQDERDMIDLIATSNCDVCWILSRIRLWAT
jgi:hypothetical protein